MTIWKILMAEVTKLILRARIEELWQKKSFQKKLSTWKSFRHNVWSKLTQIPRRFFSHNFRCSLFSVFSASLISSANASCHFHIFFLLENLGVSGLLFEVNFLVLLEIGLLPCCFPSDSLALGTCFHQLPKPSIGNFWLFSEFIKVSDGIIAKFCLLSQLFRQHLYLDNHFWSDLNVDFKFEAPRIAFIVNLKESA